MKTKKRKQKQYTYSESDYMSGDGMLTSVWGPSMWHFLHTMSFNYPVSPTDEDKNIIKNLLQICNIRCHVNFAESI